jgi:hypothetical protein
VRAEASAWRGAVPEWKRRSHLTEGVPDAAFRKMSLALGRVASARDDRVARAVAEVYWMGAQREGELRDEGLANEVLMLRDTLEQFARLKPAADDVELVQLLAEIYLPPTFRQRLRSRAARRRISRQIREEVSKDSESL